MSSNTDVLKTLYDQIRVIAEEINSTNDKVVRSAVYAKKPNKTYQVQIKGTSYWIKNGTGIPIDIGRAVWVTIPGGDYNRMYISAFADGKEITI